MTAKKQPAHLEECLQTLDAVLEKLGSKETTLEESIALYATAARLVEQANQMLNDAQLQITEIDQSLTVWGMPEQPAAEEPSDD